MPLRLETTHMKRILAVALALLCLAAKPIQAAPPSQDESSLLAPIIHKHDAPGMAAASSLEGSPAFARPSDTTPITTERRRPATSEGSVVFLVACHLQPTLYYHGTNASRGFTMGKK